MKILRTVVVKQVVTEAKKQSIVQEFKSEILQCERELEQLTFHLHKATKDVASKHEQQTLRARYKEEIKQRKEKLAELSFKVDQLSKLEIGTELREGTVETIVEIKEGDPWPAPETEIVVKDGVVEQIRRKKE
ncbi:YlqD family protein [Halalkalibacter oceani]|uniref:YlqD family protein n=1 Tax=Halalkalibacter oceani TaxID=1653776 RepID=A0A9X2DLX9_9BACI|nr:YlqD family protein [Halalkalibacter oceani]MCM3713169.1 YlqD family protein [Halalkalibacter oceani]